MLKKIYKNNGIIYFNDLDKGDKDTINSDIKYNNIYLKNYSKYKDTLKIDEIKNISKKEYYIKLKCSY